MINFLIVTHGEFGAYMVEAAESIAGRQMQGVRSISISQRVAVGEIRTRIKAAVSDLCKEAGLVIFIDMPGGTPGNLSFPIVKDLPRVEVIGGLNLYMLISAFSHRDLSLEKLIEKILTDGKKSICDIRQMFFSKAR